MRFPLITDRLRLDVITSDDVADVFHTMNDRSIADSVSFMEWPMTMAQAQLWCDKSQNVLASDTDYYFIARHKDMPAAIGCIGLHGQLDGANLSHSERQVGYWVSADCQGQGYASEMLCAVLGFGLKNDITMFCATTAIDNPGSVRVLEKQGFVFKYKKDVQMLDGSERPSLYFERKKS